MPPQHEITALADEILAAVQEVTEGALSPRQVKALPTGIVVRLLYVRTEAGRSWLGSALTRGRGDD
jgi:hypothetical protein